MAYTTESYIKRMEHSADTFEKKGNRLWAQAKNGGPEEAYKYSQARDCYDKAKRYRASASEAAKRRGK